MERFADPIVNVLNKALKNEQSNAVPATQAFAHISVDRKDFTRPPNPEMGDFAYPCFKLAKSLKRGPPQIAKSIAQWINTNTDLMSAEAITVTAEGPYVNFRVSDERVYNALFLETLGPTAALTRGAKFEISYAKRPEKSGPTWVLEFSSPNLAKPFNIYHLRGTVLGAALTRIAKYRGHIVISINHLGDWGTQWGKLAVAYERYKSDLPAEPKVEDLVNIYIKFHADAEKNPALEDQAREAFLLLEKGDAKMKSLWQESVDISLRDFKKLYSRIGVAFDHYWGESFYQTQIDGVVSDLKKKKILEKDQGAQVVFLDPIDGTEIPPCILVKSDGATIYATRDIAAAIYRWEKFHFDRMSYIVGGEQRLHFKQVFGVLKKAAFDWASRCEHIPTGLYRFKDAKMSTRKGNFVTLESVLDLARSHVVQIMQSRTKDLELSSDELAVISDQIGVGSVIFHDLSVDPARDVEFDVERVVDMEGETGAYLQYAHTRCLSILRKAKAAEILKTDRPAYDPTLVPLLKEKEESSLIRQIAQLPTILDQCIGEGRATPLAGFLIDLTRSFNSFYRQCRVMGDDPKLTQARLMLVATSQSVLKQGLTLLGVPQPEKM